MPDDRLKDFRGGMLGPNATAPLPGVMESLGPGAFPANSAQVSSPPPTQSEFGPPSGQEGLYDGPKTFKQWFYEDSGLSKPDPKARFNLPAAMKLYEMYLQTKRTRGGRGGSPVGPDGLTPYQRDTQARNVRLDDERRTQRDTSNRYQEIGLGIRPGSEPYPAQENQRKINKVEHQNEQDTLNRQMKKWEALRSSARSKSRRLQSRIDKLDDDKLKLMNIVGFNPERKPADQKRLDAIDLKKKPLEQQRDDAEKKIEAINLEIRSASGFTPQASDNPGAEPARAIVPERGKMYDVRLKSGGTARYSGEVLLGVNGSSYEIINEVE